MPDAPIWERDAELGAQGAAERQRFRQPNGHADDEPSTVTPLIPFDPTALDGAPVPERPWLVRDWVPMVRPTGLYGAGGEGKTLLAQQLATSCAIGALWVGLPVLRCRSLLCF